jgi:hypothetical protein
MSAANVSFETVQKSLASFDQEEGKEGQNSPSQSVARLSDREIQKLPRDKRLLYLLQTNESTYLEVPAASLDYDGFLERFAIDEWTGTISDLLTQTPILREVHSQLVPERVSYLEFWQRYFYKLERMEETENKRKMLLAGLPAGNGEDEPEETSNSSNSNAIAPPSSSSMSMSMSKSSSPPLKDSKKEAEAAAEAAEVPVKADTDTVSAEGKATSGDISNVNVHEDEDESDEDMSTPLPRIPSMKGLSLEDEVGLEPVVSSPEGQTSSFEELRMGGNESGCTSRPSFMATSEEEGGGGGWEEWE